MRDDDLLPHGIRLMTEDGLRFVASYRGLQMLAARQAVLGGPNAARWKEAERRAESALMSDEPRAGQLAIAAFSDAARFQGWSVRSDTPPPAFTRQNRPSGRREPAHG
jgi:hypothetical protein